MQSPSFLSSQRVLETGRGQSNYQTLFDIDNIPSDNHVRDMLAPVELSRLFPLFGKALATLEKHKVLEDFRPLDQRILVALNGTQYYCSQKIHCDQCPHSSDCTIRHLGYLRADWMIMSACNTASGRKPGAKALSGLRAPFFMLVPVPCWSLTGRSISTLQPGRQ